MTSRTVTGNVFDLTDGAVASGVVTFEKIVTSVTGDRIHQSGVDSVNTNASGVFSIDLAVPASGSYRYRMILPNGWSFYFSIAAGASVNVATLIIAETITDSNAIVEALAAYLPLAGGTMTGQLNFSGTTHAGVRLLPLTTTQRDALTPSAGMIFSNSTTQTVQVYQGGAWVSVGGGGDLLAANNLSELTATAVTARANIGAAAASDLTTHELASTSVHGIADTAALLTTSEIGSTVQANDADLTAIAALAPANDDIIQRKTGAWTNRTVAQYVVDILAGWAAHITTFLQSANAAAARSAIGAGTGDVTGPASSTDNTIARYDLTTGKLLQGSTATVDDNGSVTLGPGNTTSNSRLIYFPNSAGTVMAEIQVAGGVLRLFPYSGYALQLGVDQNSLIYLTTTNRVGIAQASPGGKLEVNQSSTTAAIPPLKLQQADVSEEFIRFVGTSANGVLTQSIVEAADVGTATIAGYMKVFVQDDGEQLTDQSYYMPIYTLAA